jgi:GAF domain-containing protein
LVAPCSEQIGPPRFEDPDWSSSARLESLLAAEHRALELVTAGAPLRVVFEHLSQLVESQGEGLACSVFLVEGGRLRLAAAPSMPASLNRLVDGLPIGPAVGCCGAAAATASCMVATDITIDPRWAAFPSIVETAVSQGLRSCWSTPILGSDDAVLGTFAIYSRVPTMPRAPALSLVDVTTHLAGLAIERHCARALSERAQRLEEADRRKDEFLALLAHELRNPLAPILAAVDLIRAHEGDAAAVGRYPEP